MAQNRGKNFDIHTGFQGSGGKGVPQGMEIVVMVRANDSTKARMDALDQAKQQFGPRAGAITILSVKER